MNFNNFNSNNGGVRMSNVNNVFTNGSTVPALYTYSRNGGLDSPMIGRIHKAKPGCSSCGRKVA
jgi:hypothetical protein